MIQLGGSDGKAVDRRIVERGHGAWRAYIHCRSPRHGLTNRDRFDVMNRLNHGNGALRGVFDTHQSVVVHESAAALAVPRMRAASHHANLSMHIIDFVPALVLAAIGMSTDGGLDSFASAFGPFRLNPSL